MRNALKCLPETLDQFYEKILLDIDEDHTQNALRALQWIAFSARPISVSELAEALSTDYDSPPYVDPDDRFMDPNNVLRIFPAGLITVASGISSDDSESSWYEGASLEDKQEEVLQLAHFSVKEYLTSSRIHNSNVRSYRLHEEQAHRDMASTSLAYITHIGSNITLHSPSSPSPGSNAGEFRYSVEYSPQNFPLVNYTCHCWPFHVRAIGQQINEETIRLVSGFFENKTAVQV